MKRIMFVGPSGIGKTTLAKFIETKYGIPFISGSMSDLMPDTKRCIMLSFYTKNVENS